MVTVQFANHEQLPTDSPWTAQPDLVLQKTSQHLAIHSRLPQSRELGKIWRFFEARGDKKKTEKCGQGGPDEIQRGLSTRLTDEQDAQTNDTCHFFKQHLAGMEPTKMIKVKQRKCVFKTQTCSFKPHAIRERNTKTRLNLCKSKSL